MGSPPTELRTWEFTDRATRTTAVFDDWGEPEGVRLQPSEFYLDVLKTSRTHRRGLDRRNRGSQVLEVINAIYESIETGREVFLRFEPKKCR